MYLIKNCSLAVSILICCIAAALTNVISKPFSVIFILLTIAATATDIILFKVGKKKTHISALMSAVLIFAHFFAAKANITSSCAATGIFLLMLNIVIAVSYRKDNLGNSPIFHDPYLGTKASEIASWIQLSLSVTILHSIIYIGNVNYTIISFAAGSLLAVVATQIILMPMEKELARRDKAERELQIKKEQGYR